MALLFSLFIIGVAVTTCLVAYFVPTLMAFHRGHPQRIAIAVLNVFLGWSLLGWVAALVWSLTNQKPETSQYQG